MVNGSHTPDPEGDLFPHIGDGPDNETNFLAIFGWLTVLLVATLVLAAVIL